MIINDILNKIMESNSINITFHTSPDGDSLGSALALYQGIKNLGKKVDILSKEDMPKTFKFLPFSNKIDGKNYKVKEDVDCVIVLDCGNVERINAELDLENRNYFLMNIDHHMSNEFYGDLNYVNTDAAAVSESVYEILKTLNVTIDKDIAKCLYTSIITDTGSFRYPSTTENTHKVAGNLINAGVDFSSIHREIYENKDFTRLKLYGKVFEEMKLVDEKICVMKITYSMLKEIGLEEAKDTSDVISMGMQVGSVEASVLLKEAEEGIKISLRSKKFVDVRKVAEKFSGGGHVRASGAYVKGKTLHEVEKMIIESIKEELI